MNTIIILIRENEPEVFEKACNIGLSHGCQLHGALELERTQCGFTFYVQALVWSEDHIGIPSGLRDMQPESVFKLIKNDIEKYKRQK